MSAPTPHPGFGVSPERMHFAWLRDGELRIQFCGDCEKGIFYPRSLCPHCGGEELDWRNSPGTGTVHSATVVRRPDKAGGDYNVVLIDLDEGVRMMSRVDMLAGSEAVRIGQRVRAVILPQDDADPLLVFAPEARNE